MAADRTPAQTRATVPPERAAGAGLLAVATDAGMVDTLNHVLRPRGIRLGRVEPDFPAIRAELARLIECATRDPLDPRHEAAMHRETDRAARQMGGRREAAE